MLITINRHKVTEHGTESVIIVGDEQFAGIECPWKENQPDISCIPSGTYILRPHYSPRHKECYAFIGGSVSVSWEPDVTRFGCFIHVANLANEVQGCLGIGMKATTFSGVPAVAHSKDALKKFTNILGRDADHEVRITWFPIRSY